MRFLAWWFGGVTIAAVVTYAIWAVNVGRWIDHRLEPAQITRAEFCWSTRDDATRRALIASSEGRRDVIVERVMIMEPNRPHESQLHFSLRWAGIHHVYSTWWSPARREQIYAYVAARMRVCGARARSAA